MGIRRCPYKISGEAELARTHMEKLVLRHLPKISGRQIFLIRRIETFLTISLLRKF